MNDYQEILEYLGSEIGLNADSVGLLSIARGINNSMKKNCISSALDYTAKIKSNPEIFKDLIEEIKVPETWFFRDAECFNFMKNHILSNIHQYSESKPLRILSSPCSTGEEPYSAAMLALDCGLTEKSVKIIGTDISHDSLEKAKKGNFRKSSFRNDYNDFQKKYFNFEHPEYHINNQIKNIPVFIIDNLVKKDFLKYEQQFDLIFCKNLLIYLNAEARGNVLQNIRRLLKNDGMLLVGLSEINYFTRNGFEQVKHNMAFACRKVEVKSLTAGISKSTEDNKKNAPKINKKSTSENKVKIESKKEKHIRYEVPFVYSIENVKQMADKGDFAGAEKVCHTLLQNEYSNFEALYYMGLIQNSLKNIELATDYFKKVLYLNPDHYESLVHISLIYESFGDTERAMIFRNRAEKVYLKNINLIKSNE